MYSQSIQLTEKQKIRIDTLFTPEKIIEYSKTLSNEKLQYDIIKSLESKIDTLKLINESFYKSNIESLNSIQSLNTKIELSNKAYQDNLKEQADIFKKQLIKERLTIGGIGLVAVIASILILSK